MGNPRQLELDDGQRETGMTLEDPREDQIAHRQRRIEGLRRAAAGVPHRRVSDPRILPCRRVVVCRLSDMSRAAAAAEMSVGSAGSSTGSTSDHAPTRP